MKKTLLASLFFLFTLQAFPQLLEGFENTTGITGPLPATWSLSSGNWAVFERNSQANIGTAESWGINPFASVFQLEGVNVASVSREQIGIGNTSEDYLATPLVHLTTINPTISFYARTFMPGTNQGTIFKLMVAPAVNPSFQSDPTTYSLVQQWTENDFSGSFEQKTVDLSAYAGLDVYIAFVREHTQISSAIDGDRWMIDLVSQGTGSFCPAPTAVSATSVTYNSATINWNETGTATSWQFSVMPLGAPSPLPTSVPHSTSFTNPYTITGLSPSTSYDIYVRAVCAPNVYSPWSGATTITTNPSPFSCGQTFTDQGGVNGNYPNNTNYITTICPDNPGEVVTVAFTQFHTEANHDALYVYDGNSVSPANMIPSNNGAGASPGSLPGGYWGDSIPGLFISSHPTGCLTFRFMSDASNSAAGWVANVSCNSNYCTPPLNLTTTNDPADTSVVLHWSSIPSLPSEVLILPFGTPMNAQAGVAVTGSTFITTGLVAGQCYTAYVRSLCTLGASSDWVSLDFCMDDCENNGTCPDALSLIAFLDTNANGVKDTNESFFNNGTFIYHTNSGATNFGYSNSGVFAIFDNNPANSYDLRFVVNSFLTSYYTVPPTFTNVTIPLGSGNTTYYFPITQLQAYTDIEVQLNRYGSPRPGFTYTNNITYRNNGTQTITSGTVSFTKHPTISIASISEPGAVSNSNGFTFGFTNLGAFESRTISVTLQVPPIPAVNLDDLITNTATVQTLNDGFAINNTATLTQAVTGSYDPNDKMEAHGGKIAHSTFTSNDYLYYTIQFENTGTAAAEFIRVEDVLDSQLDETSFEMLNASHTVNTRRAGNELIWHFYNIDLPPTVTNPNESHGFVQFRIKPKPGYAIGDIIPNSASIYFDFNPPIITNTFNTEFVATLGNPTFDTEAITIVPNPSSDIIMITNGNVEKIIKTTIYDISGKKIYELDNDSIDSMRIDVSDFSKGMYLIELISENKFKSIKKLIIR